MPVKRDGEEGGNRRRAVSEVILEEEGDVRDCNHILTNGWLKGRGGQTKMVK